MESPWLDGIEQIIYEESRREKHLELKALEPIRTFTCTITELYPAFGKSTEKSDEGIKKKESNLKYFIMPEEKDLVLGEPENEETEETTEPEGELVTVLDVRADIRCDIDSAIAVYNFLEEIDLEGKTVLNAKMKDRLIETQKNCLLLIEKSINLLMEE